MLKPKRIQRKRTKGYRMPEGAVYVGRPTHWGNHFIVVKEQRFLFRSRQAPKREVWETTWAVWNDDEDRCISCGHNARREAAQIAVDAYRKVVQASACSQADCEELQLLRGKDLACWCPLDQPCHADVLLEIANG